MRRASFGGLRLLAGATSRRLEAAPSADHRFSFGASDGAETPTQSGNVLSNPISLYSTVCVGFVADCCVLKPSICSEQGNRDFAPAFIRGESGPDIKYELYASTRSAFPTEWCLNRTVKHGRYVLHCNSSG